MISESLYQSLTVEQQDIISEAAVLAARDQRAWVEDGETDTIEQLKEKGMNVEYPDLAEMQAAVDAYGLYETYKDSIGEDLFNDILALCQ